MTAAPTPDRYFTEWWGRSDDPWDHAGRFYERRKYDLTVACLPRRRYRRAFEPGCATGLLTARLATRADSLLAADRHGRAVRVTADRCRDTDGVRVELRRIPEEWPAGERFDLIVLSEILYYFDVAGVGEVLRLVDTALEPGGHIVAVHYRGHVDDHALSGDEVHRRLAGVQDWDGAVHHAEKDFILDVFERR